MKIFKDKRIIFTVGDYGFRDHSQNIDQTTFGKTILIDEDGKGFDILSIGHRNHQGLYYDKYRNKIYMTEHGPKGGDEINLNNLNLDKTKNYGGLSLHMENIIILRKGMIIILIIFKHPL